MWILCIMYMHYGLGAIVVLMYQQDCKSVAEELIFTILFYAENSGLHVFSFLANSILKDVLSAIQKGKPGAFSPGRPTEFLKNYKSSLSFVEYLEGDRWTFYLLFASDFVLQ